MAKIDLGQAVAAIADTNQPIEHRAMQLVDIMAGAQAGKPDCKVVAQQIFDRLEHGTGDEEVKKRIKWLDEVIAHVMSSPMRPASFIESSKIKGYTAVTAKIIMDNGEEAYVAVPDPKLVKDLKMGDRIVVDGKASIMLREPVEQFQYGHEVRYERRINGRHVEIMTQNDMKQVVLVGPDLLKQIESGDVIPGQNLIIQKNSLICLYAVPHPKDGFEHFRFLDKSPVPDVLVDRDIGSPPKIIKEVEQHIREEMTRPALRRKFKLRPCKTALLCGVSGTGKTLSVQAMHRLMYEIMSEITNTPIEGLPPRVFRFKSGQALSMWFGESEKNIERFFDEVEAMADRRFTNAKGQEFTLPVLVVMEEADGMGRARGNEAIYDRIMTTTLQRLDPARSSLANRMIVFLSTTNEPHIVDPAFLRRIGGTIEVFGRLDQRGFESVLSKHVAGLPIEGKSWKQVVKDINDWLYSPEDLGIVELKLNGYNMPMTKYRRDFMTGALIERSVHEAATQAWESAMDKEDAGITAMGLCQALDRQVQSVVHQLSEANVSRYTDMPEGAHVAAIRRIKATATK